MISYHWIWRFHSSLRLHAVPGDSSFLHPLFQSVREFSKDLYLLQLPLFVTRLPYYSVKSSRILIEIARQLVRAHLSAYLYQWCRNYGITFHKVFCLLHLSTINPTLICEQICLMRYGNVDIVVDNKANKNRKWIWRQNVSALKKNVVFPCYLKK